MVMASGWLIVRLLLALSSWQVLTSSHAKQNSICDYQMVWVPILRQKIYITFLNDVNCPSWISKYRNTLTLPQDTPFAFVCGACYSPWVEPQLTLRAEGAQTSFEPIRNRKRGLEHPVSSDRTNCLLSYGLTDRLQEAGFFECTISRKGKTWRTKITYNTVQTTLETIPHQRVLASSDTGYAQISCPNTTLSSAKNLVYVWHYPNKGDIVVKSLKKHIRLPALEKPYDVACSVYDTYDPRKVWRSTFTILPHEAGSSNTLPLGTDTYRPDSTKKPILLIIVIGGCVSLLIVFVCAAIKFCSMPSYSAPDPKFAAHVATPLAQSEH